MIRALVVDDSAYNRVTLSRMLESSGTIQVCATAVNGEDAIKQVMRHEPHVITLDLEMPIMDGFAFLRWLMANKPTPVIAVSSRASDRSVFKALELGAVDFIPKPGGRVSPRLEEIQRELIEKAQQVSAIRLDIVAQRIRDEEPRGVPTETVAPDAPHAVDLVVIGSSTGGPPALQSLFQTTPLMPIPFVVAQHMPPVFTRFFADRVNRLTHYSVKEGEPGEYLMPGVVYIAPGGMQCEVVRSDLKLQLRITTRKENELHAPSVNRLFESASDSCGDRVVGVILTGMGDDGARGIKRMREQGGRTIAESDETAIIFGMPAEAIRTGAVQEVLPLTKIPAAIHRICAATGRGG